MYDKNTILAFVKSSSKENYYFNKWLNIKKKNLEIQYWYSFQSNFSILTLNTLPYVCNTVVTPLITMPHAGSTQCSPAVYKWDKELTAASLGCVPPVDSEMKSFHRQPRWTAYSRELRNSAASFTCCTQTSGSTSNYTYAESCSASFLLLQQWTNHSRQSFIFVDGVGACLNMDSLTTCLDSTICLKQVCLKST